MKINPRFPVLPAIALLSFVSSLTLAQPTVSVITAAPMSPLIPGQTVTMTVASNSSPVTYQWQRDGVALPGATGASFTLPMVGAADRGAYRVVVTGSSGVTTVDLGSMVVTPSDARLINLSARAMVGTGGDVMIAGFVSSGDGNATNKNILLRGMGPALTGMGGMMSSGLLANPTLSVYDGKSNLMATNMGWMNAAGRATGSGTSAIPADIQPATVAMMNAMGAFSPAPGSADSALMMNAPFGAYTAIVSGGNNANGIALAECYDADQAFGNEMNTARLINLSARAVVGSGANGLIAGFVIAPGPSGAPGTVVLRAMGPALAAMGVTGVLSNPSMTLYDGNSKPLASNSGWTNLPVMATGNGASTMRAGIESAMSDIMSRVGAFPPAIGSADCALVATLPPGAYSLAVAGLADASGRTTSGVAMIEVYELH